MFTRMPDTDPVRAYDTAYQYQLRQFLGVEPRSANATLARSFLLHLARLAGLGDCFRCGKPIDDAYHLDHVKHWIGVDPALFWDVENVRLSHPRCNRHAQRKTLRRIGPDGTLLCTVCERFKLPEEFHRCKGGFMGRSSQCAVCRRAQFAAARRAKGIPARNMKGTA